MVRTEDVICIYERLLTNGIQVWLTGGWGIDALLGGQTRPHKDIDVIMLLDDVVRMGELLNCDGYGLKELWSENRWAIDSQGIETATAFVADHACHAATYAIQAATAAEITSDATTAESDWQYRCLPEHLRPVAFHPSKHQSYPDDDIRSE